MSIFRHHTFIDERTPKPKMANNAEVNNKHYYDTCDINNRTI